MTPRASILKTKLEWLTSIKADLVVFGFIPVAPQENLQPHLLRSRWAEMNEESLGSWMVLSLGKEELVGEIDGDLDART
ncbi:hypothetical protein TB2_043428 [Malus domestica]